MSALEAIQAPLLLKSLQVFKASNGGSSTGDPNAGLYTAPVSFANKNFENLRKHWMLLGFFLLVPTLVLY